MNKIIYLDSAATYQKPKIVIESQVEFLRDGYANAGRGICARSVGVDDMVGRVRQRVADFMGANAGQIVFTSGTTGAMNMIAGMLGLGNDKIVLVSDLDHHSARLPFVTGLAKTIVMPLNTELDIDINQIPYADVMVITAMSNVLGVGQNVPEIVRMARIQNPNVVVVVDAAQYVVHEKIDVKKWDADFVVWSAHKIGADTGLGLMYVKNPDKYKPVIFGGGMVNKIAGGQVFFVPGPEKFEAGTLPLTQIAGLGVAIDELEKNRPDLNLIKYMYDQLSEAPRIKMLTKRDAAVLTFVIDGMHVLDFGAFVSARDICVRVGNMCASWIHNVMGVTGSIRLSVGASNTMDEVKYVVQVIKDIIK
ncbi:MAG: aminotransferase class V-fold PLP-dependent enzyme [Alphaproteobacteria bacterium]|nr:aminotransferase class V-fold PLP-dependent enzyme [Alphaproteobacteria bacterium]